MSSIRETAICPITSKLRKFHRLLAPPRSQSEPDGHLSLAGSGAREEKIRNISARDQQNATRCHQQKERHVLHHVFISRAADSLRFCSLHGLQDHTALLIRVGVGLL